MIDAPALLRDLKRLTATLETDIRERLAATPELDASLTSEWQAAKDAARTGATSHDFKAEALTQAAVHWVLMGVFIRFLEDNGLVDRPWLTAADPARRALAQDRHEAYFRQHRGETDREYLLAAYREAGALPAMGALFDERHNPLFRLMVSGDGAMAILGFWQKVDPDTGRLVHDFTDPEWSTRFLGDLYQDLSEAAQKKFALLQTPEFVEEFILERSLDPAIAEFGYREVRLIDPTCGSGHFLLGGFARLLAHWQTHEPGRNARDAVQQALNGIYGVDLNPFAVAIARFRLLIAALQASGETRLAEAPNFRFNLAAGDSLLHGPRLGHGQLGLGGEAENLARRGYAHAFATEDLAELNRILGQRYHTVVGNPPYITVKDAALNAAYRARYATCHMKYSLGVAFTERFFELALPSPAGRGAGGEGAGYVGMITTNSFMKREFGKKLIEDWLPRVDLTHVIDTSGAYIPGHGTPTVILFGRERPPVASSVRTVMGIKGEPATPADPAQGLVWRAIVEQVDAAGSESAFVSVADTPRTTFARHPWSIGGGGAADLKEMIEEGRPRLESITDSIGFASFTGSDEVFSGPASAFRRKQFPMGFVREFVVGDAVRDWEVNVDDAAFAPYASDLTPAPLDSNAPWGRALWPYRSTLDGVVSFGGKTRKECGDLWWTWYRWVPSKYASPLTITFAEITTHNHFVLDRGGKVFKQTAPVIKLPAGAGEDAHLALLGLLNSSVACYWFQQVCHNKGRPGANVAGADERYEFRYVHNATVVANFPLADPPPLDPVRTLDRLAQEFAANCPAVFIAQAVPTRAALDAACQRSESLRCRMIAAQEELDWRCYRLYGLTESELIHPEPPEIACGERAFEIVLARRIAAGQEETTWFARHGATPITELPAHWPADYRRVVEARIALIESDKFIGLIERPEYKRRWAATPWTEQEQAALEGWLLDQLEAAQKAGAGGAAIDAALTTTNKLADRMRTDADFMQVAELYAGRADFDVAALVADLVGGVAVPLLPVLRYTEAGLRKRAEWERTWALQRCEDAIDAETLDEAERKRRKAAEIGVDGNIAVPPKYKSTDFQKTDFWRLRGGLDVPKERFVSFPHCSRDADGSLLIAWAGLNPLQLATAIATHYLDMKDNEGWEAERLKPLLAGISELVLWIRQWHNDPDPEHGMRMGDYLHGFIDEEARDLGLTREAVVGWQPAAKTARRGRRRTA